MTPKEKADDLMLKCLGLGNVMFSEQKAYAMLVVDEIIKDLNESFSVAKELHPHAQGLIGGSLTYWTEVKKEIENHTITTLCTHTA